MVVLAIDPGSKKCGLALVCSRRGVLRHTVLSLEKLGDTCAVWTEGEPADAVIVGGSTGSKSVQRTVSQRLGCQVTVVDERHTTERARLRFFVDNPPRGWRRLLPAGLLYPPVPFDDYAAVVMAEAYIAETRKQ